MQALDDELVSHPMSICKSYATHDLVHPQPISKAQTGAVESSLLASKLPCDVRRLEEEGGASFRDHPQHELNQKESSIDPQAQTPDQQALDS